MKIGIIGTGNMGRALGVRLAREGHDVAFGARRKEAAEAAAALAGETGRAETIDGAAAWGEVLIWTPREIDPAKVVGDISLLKGKIVVELNNRTLDDGWTGAPFDKASASILQENLPDSHVVKGFNLLAMEAFDTDPAELRAMGAQLFIAGESDAAKDAVGRLARDLGFEPLDFGGIGLSQALEAMADAIRYLIIKGGHGGQAHFKLVQLPTPTLGQIGDRAVSNYT